MGVSDSAINSVLPAAVNAGVREARCARGNFRAARSRPFEAHVIQILETHGYPTEGGGIRTRGVLFLRFSRTFPVTGPRMGTSQHCLTSRSSAFIVKACVARAVGQSCGCTRMGGGDLSRIARASNKCKIDGHPRRPWLDIDDRECPMGLDDGFHVFSTECHLDLGPNCDSSPKISDIGDFPRGREPRDPTRGIRTGEGRRPKIT